eukprot:5714688-Amphidinium_carterae.1
MVVGQGRLGGAGQPGFGRRSQHESVWGSPCLLADPPLRPSEHAFACAARRFPCGRRQPPRQLAGRPSPPH